MLKKALMIAGASFSLAIPASVQAQAVPYVGEIITVGFQFCPLGWAEASGQLLPISENETLFVLIGTTYGGDGQDTFGLPDLRGRAIIHQGQGPGLSNYVLSQTSGSTSVTLTTANLPPHTHSAALRAQSALGDSVTPLRNSLARAPDGQNVYSSVDPTVDMNAGDVNVQPTSGGNQPVTKTSPRLAMTNCISLFGIFPSQS